MTAKRPQEGTAVIPGNLHVPENAGAVREVLGTGAVTNGRCWW